MHSFSNGLTGLSYDVGVPELLPTADHHVVAWIMQQLGNQIGAS